MFLTSYKGEDFVLKKSKLLISNLIHLKMKSTLLRLMKVKSIKLQLEGLKILPIPSIVVVINSTIYNVVHLLLINQSHG